jgi:hypothetical protein
MPATGATAPTRLTLGHDRRGSRAASMHFALLRLEPGRNRDRVRRRLFGASDDKFEPYVPPLSRPARCVASPIIGDPTPAPISDVQNAVAWTHDGAFVHTRSPIGGVNNDCRAVYVLDASMTDQTPALLLVDPPSWRRRLRGRHALRRRDRVSRSGLVAGLALAWVVATSGCRGRDRAGGAGARAPTRWARSMPGPAAPHRRRPGAAGGPGRPGRGGRGGRALRARPGARGAQRSRPRHRHRRRLSRVYPAHRRRMGGAARGPGRAVGRRERRRRRRRQPDHRRPRGRRFACDHARRPPRRGPPAGLRRPLERRRDPAPGRVRGRRDDIQRVTLHLVGRDNPARRPPRVASTLGGT